MDYLEHFDLAQSARQAYAAAPSGSSVALRVQAKGPLAERLVKAPAKGAKDRSEEHTSELQSLAYLVCRLLLEKKKKKHTSNVTVAETNRQEFPQTRVVLIC